MNASGWVDKLGLYDEKSYASIDLRCAELSVITGNQPVRSLDLTVYPEK